MSMVFSKRSLSLTFWVLKINFGLKCFKSLFMIWIQESSPCLFVSVKPICKLQEAHFMFSLWHKIGNCKLQIWFKQANYTTGQGNFELSSLTQFTKVIASSLTLDEILIIAVLSRLAVKRNFFHFMQTGLRWLATYSHFKLLHIGCHIAHGMITEKFSFSPKVISLST